MAEDTYELRLEQEGFHIIPVHGGEVAMSQNKTIFISTVWQVDLHGGVGGQIAVQLLQAQSQQGASSTKGLMKELPSNLFLEQPSGDHKEEGQLVIQYGDSWFQDLLSDLGRLGTCALDFPVFCSDGIAWSNRLVNFQSLGVLAMKYFRLLLASVSPLLTASLDDEDSCLILPDCSLAHFNQFHQHLFSRALPITSVAAVSRVASLLCVPSLLLPRIHSSSKSFNTQFLDYQAIFSRQQREYLDKCYGNRWVANQVLKVAERPARRRQPLAFLASVMRPSSPLGIPDQETVWCDQCSISFANKELLDQHMEILHKALAKPRERNFPCSFCDKRFQFQDNVQKHILLVHPGLKERPDDKENVEGAPELNRIDKRTDSKKESPQQQSQPTDVGDQFKCKICGDYCRTKRALLAHMQAHYGGGYRCDFPGCESVFKENAKLTRHKLVHTGVKAWKCSYCHLAFSLKHNLKMHEKTHTRTDMLKCRLCNYQTIQKSNLRLHEATHGEAGVKVRRGGRWVE